MDKIFNLLSKLNNSKQVKLLEKVQSIVIIIHIFVIYEKCLVLLAFEVLNFILSFKYCELID